MRIILAVLIAVVAVYAFSGELVPATDSADSVTPVIKWKYQYSTEDDADASQFEYDSPHEAYEAGATGLVAMCGGVQSCIDYGELAIYPNTPGKLTEELVEHGWVRMTELLRVEIDRLHAFFRNNNARGADYARSIENTDSIVYSWHSFAKNYTQITDRLRKEIGAARDTIIDQGEQYYGSEHAALVQRRLKLDGARTAIDDYTSEIGSLADSYTSAANDYSKYHASEQLVINAMADLIVRANVSALGDFGPLQAKLVALAQAELTTSAPLLTQIKRIRRRLVFTQGELEVWVEPLRDFLAQEGIVVPELTGVTVGHLDKMVRYIESRVVRLNHKTAEVLQRLQDRHSALIREAADEATQDTIRATAAAAARTDFLERANQQISELWSAGPYAGDVELLAPRHQKVLAILQMEGICEAGRRLSWMDDGCTAINRNIRRARSYLDFSLRFKLLSGASNFRGRSAPEALVAEMSSAFDGGDVERALFVHDQIAQDLEAQ